MFKRYTGHQRAELSQTLTVEKVCQKLQHKFNGSPLGGGCLIYH